MTVNTIFQLGMALLALAVYLLATTQHPRARSIDRLIFWLAGLILLGFVFHRPFGIAADDAGNEHNRMLEGVCPYLECGKMIQGRRDQAWYSLMGLLSSFLPLKQSALTLAGLGLIIKLFVIDRFCSNRALALLVYAGLFYVIHDVTALRASFAIAVYLLGLVLLVGGYRWLGGSTLFFDGFVHTQAFAAPLLLAATRWVVSVPMVRWAMLIPVGLLMIGLYPGELSYRLLDNIAAGDKIIQILTGGYISYLTNPDTPGFRAWPLVVPPAVGMAVWMLPSLRERNESLFQFTSWSLMIACCLLWATPLIPPMQFRLFNFFFVPVFLVFGNAILDRIKLIAIMGMVALYVIKYTLLHAIISNEWEARLTDNEDGLYLFGLSLVELFPVDIMVGTGGSLYDGNTGKFCFDQCTWKIDMGSVHRIKAVADEGYYFAGWLGACRDLESECAIKGYAPLRLSAKFRPLESL
jgi:hypothetical protein